MYEYIYRCLRTLSLAIRSSNVGLLEADAICACQCLGAWMRVSMIVMGMFVYVPVNEY